MCLFNLDTWMAWFPPRAMLFSQINSNGPISIPATTAYNSHRFRTGSSQKQWAAVWDDLDIRYSSSRAIYYRWSTNSAELSRAQGMVNLLLSRYTTSPVFSAQWMVIVTWRSVIRYSQSGRVRIFLIFWMFSVFLLFSLSFTLSIQIIFSISKQKSGKHPQGRSNAEKIG